MCPSLLAAALRESCSEISPSLNKDRCETPTFAWQRRAGELARHIAPSIGRRRCSPIDSPMATKADTVVTKGRTRSWVFSRLDDNATGMRLVTGTSSTRHVTVGRRRAKVGETRTRYQPNLESSRSPHICAAAFSAQSRGRCSFKHSSVWGSGTAKRRKTHNGEVTAKISYRARSDRRRTLAALVRQSGMLQRHSALRYRIPRCGSLVAALRTV